MKNLINFILRNVHWLLFALLLIASVALIVQNNQFQRSKYLSLFHDMSGRLHSVSKSLDFYTGLRRTNTELHEQLALLQTELDYYKNKYLEARMDSVLLPFDFDEAALNHIPALVVNNQVFGIENYITINKGSSDGIERDMGIVSAQGIVGVVMRESSHFARVIPLLNPGFRPSCKVKRSDYFGPMVWDGKDPRYSYLEELPRYAVYEIGDTVVTSGYSSVFPEGVPVGIVVGSRKEENNDYTALKVELFTDFASVREVFAIANPLKEEQKTLEEE